VPAVTYSDLNINCKLKPAGGGATLFLNIRNAFDTPPDPAATGGCSSFVPISRRIVITF
jgi:hypothetical protein